MDTLFLLSNLLVLPFWFLMIIRPRWPWTQRIIASPWIILPPALLYVVLLLSQLGNTTQTLLTPNLATIANLLGQPAGATVAWAHFVTFDLFAGRWAYLDSRERNLSPWLMATLLFLILMVGPFGLLLYLLTREVVARRQP